MSVANFIPALWAARLLNSLDKSHVATNLVNRDYEGDIKAHGDKVHINTITNPTIRSYTAGTNITVEDVATTEIALEITQAKYFAFKVDDVDRAQAAGDYVDKAMTQASYGLNDVSDAYLLSVMAAGADSGNIIASTALTAANIYENIVLLRKIMDKANVPTAGRGLVIPPDAYALLLLDERFTKVGTKSEEVVRNGQVGEVAGFTVFESNNCPVVSNATQIIATVSSATTYAEQILKTEAMRMESQFSDMVRGLHVYGAKVTDGKQIAVLNATF